MSTASATTSAFFLYRDSPLRRAALGAPVGDPSRYSLYGLDELAAAGVRVEHSLEPQLAPGSRHRIEARMLDRVVHLGGGYSGDFATVLAALPAANRSDVVFSTVDTVGIPLALLGRLGLVKPPVVYAAIGLPERLGQLRGSAAKRLFRDAYRRLSTIVAYGWGEVDELRRWLDGGGPPVEFVPFGVDESYFRPAPDAPIEADVVSVGADQRRDFASLVEVARRRPEQSFRIVASRDNAPDAETLPANVRVEIDIPFELVRERLVRARVVALPVHENTYSGATTTLLQAMACGRPVVVTRTAAIDRGYHLEDRVNCRLVAPGDVAGLEHAVVQTLEDPGSSDGLGLRARETVERSLTWSRYTDAISGLVVAAAERRAAHA